MTQTVVQQIAAQAPDDLTYGPRLLHGETVNTLANLIQNPGLIGGAISYAGVPTADPHVVGQLWANAGVLTVSAG